LKNQGFDIKGKKVTVLGAARSGVAVSKLLARKEAKVFLSEKASPDDKIREVDALKKANIPSEFGGHTDRIFDADMWVVSPGIPYSSPVLQVARDREVPVWGELEVASWFCQSPIVAVTGSNGKSTTTVLLGTIFRTAEISCIVAGNIGQPLSDYVEETVPDGVAVVEVSSFQLETILHFHPRIAIFLNLTPDHLDRHGSMQNYGKIKSRLFENQDGNDYLIFNGKDPQVLHFTQSAVSQKVVFGLEDNALKCGYIRNGVMILRLDDEDEEILPAGEISIRGEHNVANSLAAALAARSMGVEVDSIRQALKTFKGLPHRMEFAREVDGIEWVNDSKATNTDSVWYALGSFSTPVILIAGGRDKNSDFTVLRDRIQEGVRSVVLLGEATEKIEEALRGLCPLVRAASLKEAVNRARALAHRGDVVLLSPGCASFDMFKNFEDRGEQFKTIVGQL